MRQREVSRQAEQAGQQHKRTQRGWLCAHLKIGEAVVAHGGEQARL
jgi:hypothetical protein